MPFVAECPFCSKGKLLCPDHAVGWSAACPNPECGSSFTITRSANAPTVKRGQHSMAKAVAGGHGANDSSPTDTANAAAHPAPIIVNPSAAYASAATRHRPEFTSKWNGATVFAFFLGSLALLGASFLNHWPIVIVVAAVAALTLLVGFAGINVANQRDLGRKRAWLGLFAPAMALVVLGLPYLTGARWHEPTQVVAPDLQQRTAIPIKPLTGTDKSVATDDWIDASKELILLGDVWLRIVSVAVEPVKLKAGGQPISSDDRWLVIRVQIANTGASRRIDYQSWADGSKEPPAHAAVLRDQGERLLRQRSFASASIVGQVASGYVFPGKALDDVLVFEPPPGRFDYLRLELPLAAIGDEEHVRLQLPRTMIKFR